MDLNNAVELIPKRFYWMAKSKAPINTGNVHFFNIDKTLTYQPFANDFGPLSASCVAKYVRIVESKLIDPALITSKIVHYCTTSPSAKSNSAVLAIIYTVISLSPKPVEEMEMSDLIPLIDSVLSNFRDIQLMPFRDASGSPSTYSLSVASVVKGLIRAMTMGYYNPKTFSIREYDFYEKVENGDMTWIIPERIIAFAGPEDPVFNAQNGHSIADHYTLPPGAYVPYFQKHNVRTVIRLNSPRYRKESFESRGIRVIDLIFPDGSCPSPDISNSFATEIDNGDQDNYAIAVHCKAGLGRTGTLIGMVLMTRGFTAPEAIGYLRIMRPGSVVGWQQNFMLEKELQCRRHELAVPKRMMVTNRKLKENTDSKKQIRTIKKQGLGISSKFNFGTISDKIPIKITRPLSQFGMSIASNNNVTLKKDQKASSGFFNNYSNRAKTSNSKSFMRNNKQYGIQTKISREKIKENEIIGLGICPNTNLKTDNINTVNKYQRVSVYHVNEDGTIIQQAQKSRPDSELKDSIEKFDHKQQLGPSKVYKPPYVRTPEVVAGPIQVFRSSVEKTPIAERKTMSKNNMEEGNSCKNDDTFPVLRNNVNLTSIMASPMISGQKYPNYYSLKSSQHNYIHLPNLHPVTSESCVSPQPRKTANGRYVERLNPTSPVPSLEMGHSSSSLVDYGQQNSMKSLFIGPNVRKISSE